MTRQAPADQVGEKFAGLGYYEDVRGVIRREITREILLDELIQSGTTQGDVIDVGGGSGSDLRWINEIGQYGRLHLVEPDENVRSTAIAKNPRIKCRSSERTVHDLVGKTMHRNRYQVVLSHGVLMYDFERAQEHVDTLVNLTAPGGLISLFTKGFAGSKNRMIREGRTPQEIEDFEKTRIGIFNVGVPVRAYDFAELEQMLITAGAHIVRKAGIRSEEGDKDDRQWHEVDPLERHEILKRERVFADDRINRHRGQMLLVIAKK